MRKIVLLLLVGLGACAFQPTEAQKASLAATQAVVNERVKTGQITPAEGELIMARERAAQDAERRDRYARAVSGGDGPAVYQQVGPGTVIRY